MGLHVDTATSPAETGRLDRLETARRRQFASSHDVVSSLDRNDHGEIGAILHKVIADVVRVSLTEKGKDACDVVSALYQRQLGSIEAVGEVQRGNVQDLNKTLVRLDRFWSDQIRYRL